MISIKSEKEIELMRIAGKIVAMAHEQIGKAIRPGITTAELDAIAERVITENGAYPSFKGKEGINKSVYPASICASINSEVVHGIPSSKRTLKDGDIVSIDIGAYYQGYHGDAAITHPVGKITPEAQRLIDVTRQSFYEGIKLARNGNRLSDISNAVQMYVESNGFSVVRDFVGHGIGRELQEDPQIPNYGKPGYGPRLMPGMTIAIEPMINVGNYNVNILQDNWTVVTADGCLSSHYENTILITEGEPEILTRV
jgi:methionyl aminopeptidase